MFKIVLEIETSISIPSSSKTSAEPHFELIDLFPCLATCIPAPATTKDATVEILKLPKESPPVPHISIDGTLIAAFFILFLMA